MAEATLVGAIVRAADAGRSMIITRTPLRISLGGGGTDLLSFYEQQGGFVVAASIAEYVYIGMNAPFTDDYFLKYSALERTGALAPEPARLRRGLTGVGLAEVRFAFDHDGSVVLLRG